MSLELYKKIITEQQEEVLVMKSNPSIVDRHYLQEFDQMMNTDLIKVIMGVRRTGKSVLALKAYNDREFVYINFDDERLINLTASIFLLSMKQLNGFHRRIKI